MRERFVLATCKLNQVDICRSSKASLLRRIRSDTYFVKEISDTLEVCRVRGGCQTGLSWRRPHRLPRPAMLTHDACISSNRMLSGKSLNLIGQPLLTIWGKELARHKK